MRHINRVWWTGRVWSHWTTAQPPDQNALLSRLMVMSLAVLRALWVVAEQGSRTLRASPTLLAFPARHPAIPLRCLRLNQAGLFPSTELGPAENLRRRVEQGANRACGNERPTKRLVRPIAQQTPFVATDYRFAPQRAVQKPDIAVQQQHALVPVTAPPVAQPAGPLAPWAARQFGQGSRCLGNLLSACCWLGFLSFLIHGQTRCYFISNCLGRSPVFGVVAASWK